MNQPMTPATAFNNVQMIVRKCKDPVLDMDNSEQLGTSLRIIAAELELVPKLQKTIEELQAKVKELTSTPDDDGDKEEAAATEPNGAETPSDHPESP